MKGIVGVAMRDLQNSGVCSSILKLIVLPSNSVSAAAAADLDVGRDGALREALRSGGFFIFADEEYRRARRKPFLDVQTLNRVLGCGRLDVSLEIPLRTFLSNSLNTRFGRDMMIMSGETASLTESKWLQIIKCRVCHPFKLIQTP